METAASKEKHIAIYPRFRGCVEDLSYEEARKCSEQKIVNFIKMRFDTEMESLAFPLNKST
jgi:hypothetical protein